jgi:hypothetical protein
MIFFFCFFSAKKQRMVENFVLLCRWAVGPRCSIQQRSTTCRCGARTCRMALPPRAAIGRVISCLPPPLHPPPMLPARLLRHRLAAAASSPLRVVAAAMSSSSASAHGGAGKPNRLAAEHSPYLLQHAHNPVSEASADLSLTRATVSSPRDSAEHLAVAYSLPASSSIRRIHWFCGVVPENLVGYVVQIYCQFIFCKF